MKIYLGADHAGYELKEKIKTFLIGLDYKIEDFGAFEYEIDDDYPDFVTPVAEATVRDQKEAGLTSMGIVFGGSGQGEAMCANKIKGVRAGVYYGKSKNQTDINGNNLDIISSMRKHNNANVLSIGARFVDEKEAQDVVKIFLETEFSDKQRHVQRISKF